MNTVKGALSNEELKILSPSCFATEPAPDVSRNRYHFVPTIQIVEALRSESWFPVQAVEVKSRTSNRIGYGKHMLRFRQADKVLNKVGEVVPEIVLFNAHDGSGKVTLDAGLFRLICSNGMVIADESFASIAVKHSTPNLVDEIIKQTFAIAKQLPKITGSISEMMSISLTPNKQKSFAEKALVLRYDDVEDSPITIDQLLLQRREQDKGDDLWHTFNRIQENMITGGIDGVSHSGRKVKTKGIKSVTEDLRLNRGLWEIADTYRQKAA